MIFQFYMLCLSEMRIIMFNTEIVEAEVDAA